jgi:hypothetical protein
MHPDTCRDASVTSPQAGEESAGEGGRAPAATERSTRRVTVLNSRMLARLCALSSLLLVIGCGRPATQQECEEIVVRVTELELKARGIAGSDGQEVQETKEALRKTTMQDCVGRRISDKAMACVRSAKTAQELVGECF